MSGQISIEAERTLVPVIQLHLTRTRVRCEGGYQLPVSHTTLTAVAADGSLYQTGECSVCHEILNLVEPHQV